MTDAQLTFVSSWASIISFFVSIASLLYVRSIKANIVRFRRKQRIRQICNEVNQIPDDAVPLSKASLTKLASLKRNISTPVVIRWTEKARATRELRKHIDAQDIASIKEAINDWTSFSEDV
jgi:DNA-directed RNA polymerase specialized sigma24 family protein